MELKEIGKIYTKFADPQDAPRQGYFTEEMARVEVYPEFSDALLGVEEDAHYLMIYWADRADRNALQKKPPCGDKEYGVFALRSPHRPNPLNVCTVTIHKIEGSTLYVTGLDSLDGSPLIDIKPYIQQLDYVPSEV